MPGVDALGWLKGAQFKLAKCFQYSPKLIGLFADIKNGCRDNRQPFFFHCSSLRACFCLKHALFIVWFTCRASCRKRALSLANPPDKLG